MLEIYLKGLALGASLIMAIGAQNAFVLSQGVRKKYNVIIPFICSLSDAILISVGVLGVGQFMASQALISNIASIGGALFLFWYGLRTFKSFLKPGTMEETDDGPQSLKAAVLFTLAVTLLNPHVYIDTILLLGSISSQFSGNGRYLFGAGAVSASFLWFFTLSLGGNLLSPLFKSPLSWRILDLIISFIMWYIAFTLIRKFIFF